MKYLLDSNAVIRLLNKSSDALDRQVRSRNPGEIVTSSIVMHELFFGALKSQSISRNLRAIDELQFTILDFDKSDGREAGEIRVFLRQQGTTIGPYDILIAGQARSRGLILVTHNVKEFIRVPRLVMEDWEV